MDNRDKKKHPIQPLAIDGQGTLRFKENAIVRRILDEGSIDLNDIAKWDVSAEDHCQFAQLIGYSHSGFGTLSYVDEETYEVAEAIFKKGTPELEARAEHLRACIEEFKRAIRKPVAALFGIHPDDLGDNLVPG